MVTSSCVTDECANDIDHQLGTLQLTVDNSTIDDTYEHYDYDVTNNDVRDHDLYNTYGLGNAITLDQEANVVIQNNSHIAGITLTQGYHWADDVTNNPAIFTDTLTVKDTVVTSGAYSELDKNGFYGQSARPSDYSSSAYLNADDVALAVIANPNSDNSMQTTATFDHSTLTGDLIFSSNFDQNFYAHGYDSNGDGVRDTNGWDDQDSLSLKLDNGSKWVGAAASLRMVDSDGNGVYDSYARGTDATADLYDYAANSIWPESTYSYDDPTTAVDESGYLVGTSVYQSGLFDVTLDHGSE